MATAVRGLNIEAIRELNKIHVYAVKDKVQEQRLKAADGSMIASYMEEIFTAYLTSPIGKFDASISDGSITKEIGDIIGKSKIASIIGETAVGSVIKSMKQDSPGLLNFLGSDIELSNQLNYNFNYRFTGISEFKKTFSCELVMKDDLFTDVIDPLWKLLDYVLPDETVQLHETDVYGEGKQWTREMYNTIKKGVKDFTNDFIEQDILDKFWNYVEGLGGEADDMLGGLSFMKKPKQLQGGNLFTRIVIGNYIVIDNVIIEAVGFDIPYLFYEGGLFDKVTVTLSVKGNRKMSLKTYDWLRQLSYAAEGGYYVTSKKKLNSDTLNALFEGDYKRNPPLKEKQEKPADAANTKP